jgi:hypothetical protein
MLAIGKSRTERKSETRYDFLMARRLKCALCNHTYIYMYNARGYCYYRCNGKNKALNYVCQTDNLKREAVDNKTKEFIRELLLNPRRLFAWWQEQHAAKAKSREQHQQDLVTVESKVRTTTEKYHRTLDRITDTLDDDEIAYYTRQRDSLKDLLTEYRDELERLLAVDMEPDVSEGIIQGFMEMGEEYRYALEHSTSFTFWRGLVDDLDIEGLIGLEGRRRYIDFIVFGKRRKREYLDTEPNSEGSEQSEIDFAGINPVAPLTRSSTTRPAGRQPRRPDHPAGVRHRQPHAAAAAARLLRGLHRTGGAVRLAAHCGRRTRRFQLAQRAAGARILALRAARRPELVQCDAAGLRPENARAIV